MSTVLILIVLMITASVLLLPRPLQFSTNSICHGGRPLRGFVHGREEDEEKKPKQEEKTMKYIVAFNGDAYGPFDNLFEAERFLKSKGFSINEELGGWWNHSVHAQIFHFFGTT